MCKSAASTISHKAAVVANEGHGKRRLVVQSLRRRCVEPTMAFLMTYQIVGTVGGTRSYDLLLTVNLQEQLLPTLLVEFRSLHTKLVHTTHRPQASFPRLL